jgi:hypothetical protein
MSFVFSFKSNTVAPVQIISMNLLGTALVMFAAVCTAVAERPTTAADWVNHVEAQVIVVPKKDALQLLDELYDASRVENGYAKVMALVNDGTAKLASVTVLQAKHLTRIEKSTTTPIRFPVWFATLQEAGPAVEKATVDTRLPATEFDHANVGLTIDCHATISEDGGSLRLIAAVKHRQFLGMSRIDSAILPSGAKAFYEVPRLTQCESSSEVFLKSGGRVLLGAHLVDEPVPGVELHFVRAWNTPAPAPKKTKRAK